MDDIQGLIEAKERCEREQRYGEAVKFLHDALRSGFSESEYNKQRDALCRKQLQRIGDYNCIARYSDALRAIEDIEPYLTAEDGKLGNILLNEKEIAQRKTFLKSRPRSLNAGLTSACNLRCVMCPVPKDPWSINETVRREIVELMPYLEWVDWCGGEAVLYDGFEGLCDAARAHSVHQTLTTNGLLLDRRWAEKFLACGAEIRISVDGVTKEVFESIRRGARFEALIESVKMLSRVKAELNSRSQLSVNAVVMRSNYCQLEAFVEFAARYGFNVVSFILMKSEEPLDEDIYYFTREEKILEYFDAMRGVLQAKGDGYGIRIINTLPGKEHEARGGQEKAPVGFNCLLPWKRLMIHPHGDVRSECWCPAPVGNVTHQSLHEIWNGAAMARYRETIVAGNFGELCSADCTGGRIGRSVLEHR